MTLNPDMAFLLTLSSFFTRSSTTSTVATVGSSGSTDFIGLAISLGVTEVLLTSCTPLAMLGSGEGGGGVCSVMGEMGKIGFLSSETRRSNRAKERSGNPA